MDIHPSINHWLGHLADQGKSQATLAAYRRGLVHFAQWSEQTYGQPFEPAAIIPRDVEDWKAHQQTIEKAAPATINNRLTALSRYFIWAVTEELVRTDPTLQVSGVRETARKPKSLKKAYTRRLLRRINEAGQVRDAAIVELLLGTGLRVSELLNLRRSDIILNRRSGEVVVRRGKGGVHRRVPLTAPVRRALQAYLDTQPRLKEEEFLWVGQRGPLQDRSGIFNMLKKYAFQAGLDPDKISPHITRHTMATRYLAANPDDLRGLAAILGHSDLKTVMIYTEPTTADLAGRMEKAEQAAQAQATDDDEEEE